MPLPPFYESIRSIFCVLSLSFPAPIFGNCPSHSRRKNILVRTQAQQTEKEMKRSKDVPQIYHALLPARVECDQKREICEIHFSQTTAKGFFLFATNVRRRQGAYFEPAVTKEKQMWGAFGKSPPAIIESVCVCVSSS